jgi:hypothetical protein
MALQRLSPGMQDAEEADLGPETGGVGCNLQQSGCTGFEQESKEGFPVLPDQRDQRMRHTENQMEIANREQFLLPRP